MTVDTSRPPSDHPLGVTLLLAGEVWSRDLPKLEDGLVGPDDLDIFGPGPMVRARRLRRELKRLRNDAGLNVDDAGRRAGLSGPTISRIESGMTVDEVEKLLDTRHS